MTKRNMRKNKCVSLLLAVLCALLCAAPLFACTPKESPWSIREETPEQAFRSDEFSYRLLPERGEVVKLASTGLRSLRKNGKELLVFDAPVKLYGEEGDGGFRLTVVDPDGAKPVPAVNRLF